MGCTRYLIAYSGGLDSHVLLHLCAQLRSTRSIIQLRAVYINHGLSGNASKWGKHGAAVCRDLKIDFTEKKIKIPKTSGQSLEEIARESRYQIFADMLMQDEILLTGHHEDDQAETVLLQLLRGAGPRGLSGMPITKRFAHSWHVRPLLHLSREDLKEYAAQYRLKWIEDESNQDLNFTRNYLRHKILPLLQKRWPSIQKTLSRVAKNCQETQELLEEITNQELKSVRGHLPHTLAIQRLKEWGGAKQRLIIRAWLEELGFPLPTSAKLKQIENAINARADRFPHIKWQNVEIRRYHQELYAIPCLTLHDSTRVIEWNLKEPLVLEGLGTLKADLKNWKGEIKKTKVRFRQGGENCYLPHRHHHHELKKLFQEWNVPPWERDRIPLIYIEEKLVAVVGFFRDEKELPALSYLK